MSEELVIEVERRTSTGKGSSKKLRRAGMIPAVVYGGGKESVPVVVDRHAVTELFRQHQGHHPLFLLKMKGTKQERHALLLDAQRNLITGQYVHLDFIRVLKGQHVKVEVPIVVEGEAAGVKVGGFLDWVSRSVHVECESDKIPSSIHVDISALELGEHITASQLSLPDGVKLLEDPHRVVVTVEKHGLKLSEAEEAAAAAVAPTEETTEPEVIRRGKAVPEEEGE